MSISDLISLFTGLEPVRPFREDFAWGETLEVAEIVVDEDANSLVATEEGVEGVDGVATGTIGAVEKPAGGAVFSVHQSRKSTDLSIVIGSLRFSYVPIRVG